MDETDFSIDAAYGASSVGEEWRFRKRVEKATALLDALRVSSSVLSGNFSSLDDGYTPHLATWAGLGLSV